MGKIDPRKLFDAHQFHLAQATRKQDIRLMREIAHRMAELERAFPEIKDDVCD